MSKRVVSNKRDREKLKQQKRQDKIKRKEVRQNSGTSSFEEMIAYVDEFGMLHESQETIQKQGVNLEDVQIAVPKQENVEIVPLVGRVDFFNKDKGFGFIKDETNGERHFFHISSAPDAIAEGQFVNFELERGPRGMMAGQIKIIQ